MAFAPRGVCASLTAITRLALLLRAPPLPIAIFCLLDWCALPFPCPRSGNVYPYHALAKLRAGSADGFETYALNPLIPESARSGKLRMSACDVVFFDKCAELADASVGGARPDRIWVPRAQTYASIDLILPGQRPANFTINETHQLLLFAKNSTDGLIPVAKSLGLPSAGRIPFYWVMPRERFDLVRERGPKPFPVVLGAHSVMNADGAAPADGSVPADGRDSKNGSDSEDMEEAHESGAVVTGSAESGATSPVPIAPSGGVGAGAAALAASAPASAAPRGRGRPRKQPADGATSVVLDYAHRIDQYLLLVPFDVLKPGAPTPPADLP